MGVSIKQNYKVKLVRTYTITVAAYDEEDAVEVAYQTKFSNPEWDFDDDWSAERNYDDYDEYEEDVKRDEYDRRQDHLEPDQQ